MQVKFRVMAKVTRRGEIEDMLLLYCNDYKTCEDFCDEFTVNRCLFPVHYLFIEKVWMPTENRLPSSKP